MASALRCTQLLNRSLANIQRQSIQYNPIKCVIPVFSRDITANYRSYHDHQQNRKNSVKWNALQLVSIGYIVSIAVCNWKR